MVFYVTEVIHNFTELIGLMNLNILLFDFHRVLTENENY